jgi:hypothetical protein
MPRGRFDETPVRRVTGIIKDEPSPGTPPEAGEAGLGGSLAIQQKDVGNIKFANRYRRKLAIAVASAFSKYLGVPFPAIVIGNFEPEDYFPDDLLLYDSIAVGQVAAQTQQVMIFNPTGSGLLVVVEETQVCRLNTAGLIEQHVITALPGASAVAAALARDMRLGVVQGAASTVVVQSTTGAASVAPGTALGVSGASQSPLVIRAPFILLPGFGLLYQPSIVNEGIVGYWSWRQHQLVKGGDV